MAILTNLALAGMLLGYLVVQLRRLPEDLTHPLSLTLGAAYAYQQTAVVEFPQSGAGAVFTSLKVSFTHALLSPENSADTAVFLCLHHRPLASARSEWGCVRPTRDLARLEFLQELVPTQIR
jgi:hypothetical protein